jgi:hypothetical protein
VTVVWSPLRSALLRKPFSSPLLLLLVVAAVAGDVTGALGMLLLLVVAALAGDVTGALGMLLLLVVAAVAGDVTGALGLLLLLLVVVEVLPAGALLLATGTDPCLLAGRADARAVAVRGALLLLLVPPAAAVAVAGRVPGVGDTRGLPDLALDTAAAAAVTPGLAALWSAMRGCTAVRGATSLLCPAGDVGRGAAAARLLLRLGPAGSSSAAGLTCKIKSVALVRCGVLKALCLRARLQLTWICSLMWLWSGCRLTRTTCPSSKGAWTPLDFLRLPPRSKRSAKASSREPAKAAPAAGAYGFKYVRISRVLLPDPKPFTAASG